MVNLANAIVLQAVYQSWLLENTRWPNCKMARCVFLSWLEDELNG